MSDIAKKRKLQWEAWRPALLVVLLTVMLPSAVLAQSSQASFEERRFAVGGGFLGGGLLSYDGNEPFRPGFSGGFEVRLTENSSLVAEGFYTSGYDLYGFEQDGASYPFFRHDYFAEANTFGDGFVGWFTLRLEPGADPVEVSNAIDMEFANSPNETETSTEAAFAASFAKQFGNIALIVRLILAAVFFTLLLVTGNTMAQSVRERTAELAVLKTVGFADGTVLGIVLSESILIMLIGGLLGLAVGWFVSQGIAAALSAFVPGIIVSAEIVLAALAFMIAAGVLAGLFPALHARRLSIVDALARG